MNSRKLFNMSNIDGCCSCLHRAKKDAAAIPNAGFKIALRSNHKHLGQIIIPFQSKRIPLESLGLRDLLSIGTN